MQCGVYRCRIEKYTRGVALDVEITLVERRCHLLGKARADREDVVAVVDFLVERFDLYFGAELHCVDVLLSLGARELEDDSKNEHNADTQRIVEVRNDLQRRDRCQARSYK